MGGLAASFTRRAWPRRVAYAALFLPAVLALGTSVGGGDHIAVTSFGPASLGILLTLLSWAYRVAEVAALLALAAAVVLIVRDVRGRGYPQAGDPGARRPVAPD